MQQKEHVKIPENPASLRYLMRNGRLSRMHAASKAASNPANEPEEILAPLAEDEVAPDGACDHPLELG